MPRTSDARQKMIESAAELFRERGVHGTSFADVLERSGAPRGSVYHHFRGGKAEIAGEALDWAGELTLASLTDTLAEHDPVAAVDAWSQEWGRLLRETDFAAGCSVLAAVQDGGHEPAAAEAAGRVFARWEAAIADALSAHGAAPERAASLATLLVASVEGAVVLARGQRSLAPLERVTAELRVVVAGAVG